MKNENGEFLLEEGDVFGPAQDPNLWPPFQVTSQGDGDYVKLTGFAIGDPIVAKARVGSLIRGVFEQDMPGMEPYTVEQKAAKRSFVSLVQSSGEKFDLGSWPEA